MILPFNEMPLGSRIWIYQSDKKILDQDLIKIKTKLTEFLKNWTAHGDDLKSSFEIKYNRFLIIALNEKSTKASGCSIDACVHFIQKIEKDYGLNLLDKMNVAFKQGDYISYKSIVEFKILLTPNPIGPISMAIALLFKIDNIITITLSPPKIVVCLNASL